MATPKRKADSDAERDDGEAKQARAESDDPMEEGNENEKEKGGYVTCLHEVSYPEGYDPAMKPDVPTHSKPAKEYPFTLDPFQREAVRCLEAGESVLVQFLSSSLIQFQL